MRTTLLGSLLDVAARNLARDSIASPSSSQAGSTCPPSSPATGPLAGTSSGERPAPVPEPHRLGCLAVGPAGFQVVAGRGGAGRLLRAEGSARGAWLGSLGSSCRSRRSRSRSCIRAVRPRLVIAGEPRRLDRRGPPAGLPRGGTSRAAVAFEVELAVLIATASVGEEIYDDVTSLPRRPPGPGGGRSRRGPRRRACGPLSLPAGGELLRSAEVFDLYEGEQVGAGRKSLALRLEFRAGDRTLTDEEVAGLRASIEAELEEIGGSIRG